jgi:hypothetical protein
MNGFPNVHERAQEYMRPYKRVSDGTYVGLAVPDALTNQAVWRIYREQTASGITTRRYTNQGRFNQVWDDRTALFIDISLSSTTIEENSPAGTKVADISATGGDENYTFEIVSDPSGKLRIDNDDELTMDDTALLTDGTYVIQIKCTDGNGLYYTETYVITVTETYGNSILLDGVDEYVDCGNDNSLNFDGSSGFTIAFFTKTDTSQLKILVSRANGDPTGYAVYQQGQKFFFWIRNGGNLCLINTTVDYALDTWRHVCVTYDGSKDVSGMKFYIDGVSVAKTDGTNTLGALSIANTGSNTLGSRSGGAYPFKGNLDDVCIFSTEFSAAEVLELYNGTIGLSPLNHSEVANLEAYWRLGDVDDDISTFYDYSTNTNNGTPINMEAGDIVADVMDK